MPLHPPVQRAALITGSTSGIGLGIASALAAKGYNIMLNGFGDAHVVDELRIALSRHGVKVAYSPADMRVPSDIRAMVAECVAVLGSCDVLVNNAGIQHVAEVDAFPEDKWDDIIAINLTSTFHATKAALPHMQARGWGRVINVASSHGKVGSVGKSAYVAAKHGVVGLTKVVALENANTGITANSICPGWVLTPLVRKQIEVRAWENGTSIEVESKKLLGEKQPMMAFTTPEKIGGLVVFLCSDDASTMTGGEISVDGGWTAQ